MGGGTNLRAENKVMLQREVLKGKKNLKIVFVNVPRGYCMMGTQGSRAFGICLCLRLLVLIGPK